VAVKDDVAESADVAADIDAASRGDVLITWLMTQIIMMTWQAVWR
jgi:hypothetical protein